MLLAFAASFTSGESSKFRLDPNTYRLLSTTSYFAWVAALIVSAVVVWATSALALRTGVLPRWHARAGILVGIVQLFAYLLFPFFAWWAWLTVTSVLLTLRPRAATAAVPQPAAVGR